MDGIHGRAVGRKTNSDQLQEIYSAWAAGRLTDTQAAEMELAFLKPIQPAAATWKRPKPPSSPNKHRSTARRRTLGTSSVLPSQFRGWFTGGQLAVIYIVLDEIRAKGFCDLPVDAIAARAGASRSTVQRALRGARRRKLFAVRERRQNYWRNRTSIIRVASQELRDWLNPGEQRRLRANA